MHIFPKRASLQELGGEIFKLVSYGATPEQWVEWLSVPLEHAVARGNLDLVNTLLQAGADGRAGWRGCRGRTLLDAAAVGGNPDVVTALLRAGAQPDVNVVSLSPARSALYVATVCGHADVVRRLVLAGADVRFEDPVKQRSVLHEAAYGGHEQLVNDLLIGGAYPNSDLGPYGSTPLHQAAIAGNAGIVSALLLRGAYIDAVGWDGYTSLICAADSGQVAAVETLLAGGADLNFRDRYNDSALDEAAYSGHVPVIKAILGHGADVNSRDNGGYSALHKTADTNQAAAIGSLVDAGADIELKSNSGNTPLMSAAFSSSGESLLALLKRGAAVRVRNEHGETPLHQACRMKKPGLEMAVDILLRWGADETALDSDGETPAYRLDLAQNDGDNRCSQGEVERARLLLARAPADRAWRRRGWLVMLQSRALKGKTTCHGYARNDVDGSSNAARDRAGESCKVARIQGTAGGAEDHDTSGGMTTSSSRVGGGVGAGAGGEAEFGGLSGMVALLIGLEVEGVFHTVVSFL